MWLLPGYVKNLIDWLIISKTKESSTGLLTFSYELYVLVTFTTLCANSADDKLVIFFLFSPENRI